MRTIVSWVCYVLRSACMLCQESMQPSVKKNVLPLLIRPAEVILRAGVHRLNSTVQLTHQDSGLTIKAYQACAHLILTSSIPLICCPAG